MQALVTILKTGSAYLLFRKINIVKYCTVADLNNIYIKNSTHFTHIFLNTPLYIPQL